MLPACSSPDQTADDSGGGTCGLGLSRLSIASSSTIGRRQTNEDYHVVTGVEDIGFITGQSHLYTVDRANTKNFKPTLVITDGHNGTQMAEIAAKTLGAGLNEIIGQVSTESCRGETASKIQNLYKLIDMRQAFSYNKSGCACVTVTLSEGWVVCSALGDSRAMVIGLEDKEECDDDGDGKRDRDVSEGGEEEYMEDDDTQFIKIVSLSSDHKPSKKSEILRILRGKGGVHPSVRTLSDNLGVVFNGPSRAWPGGLSLSRSLGDFCSGKMGTGTYIRAEESMTGPISNVPSVSYWKGDFDWIVLACDGLWDVLDSVTVAKFVIGADYVANMMDIEPSLFIAEALVKLAYFSGSSDNISVLVLANKRKKREVRWGTQKEMVVLGKRCVIPFADIDAVGERPNSRF